MVPSHHSLWVERLSLTNFRNYASLTIEVTAVPQVIAGANGSGKTNLLEALSLLAPGQGMRRAPFSDIPRGGGDGSFAVAARAHTLNGAADIGTGLQPGAAGQVPSGALIRGGVGSDDEDSNESLPPHPGPLPKGRGGSNHPPHPSAFITALGFFRMTLR